MSTLGHLVACLRCGGVFRRISLQSNELAMCADCGKVILRSDDLTVEEWIALTLACALLAVPALVYPVLWTDDPLAKQGVTLWKAVELLVHSLCPSLCVVITATVTAAPLVLVGLYIWTLVFAAFERRAPGFRTIVYLLNLLSQWRFFEVVWLAILAASIHLSIYEKLSVGLGSWAVVGVTVLWRYIARQDVRRLWMLTHASVRGHIETEG